MSVLDNYTLVDSGFVTIGALTEYELTGINPARRHVQIGVELYTAGNVFVAAPSTGTLTFYTKSMVVPTGEVYLAGQDIAFATGGYRVVTAGDNVLSVIVKGIDTVSETILRLRVLSSFT